MNDSSWREDPNEIGRDLLAHDRRINPKIIGRERGDEVGITSAPSLARINHSPDSFMSFAYH